MKKAKLLAVLPAAAAAIIIAAPVASAATPSITVSPSTGLKNGQTVSVTGSGYPAGLTVYVLQCADPTEAAGAGCDITNLKTVTTSASGGFTTTLAVHTGKIGDKTCAAGSSNCSIQAGDQAQTAKAGKNISFASASSSSSGSSSTGSSSTSSGTSSPSSVSSGTGGGADRNGAPIGVIVLAAVGGAAVIGGGLRLARR